jgi:hypothetical protein
MIPRNTYALAASGEPPPKKLHDPRTLPLADIHLAIYGELVKAGRPLTPCQISEALGIHYLSVSNYTRLLVNHGLIARRADGTFKLVEKI